MREKVNILMVDDQPAKLLSYEVILNELGENLIKANSGREALESPPTSPGLRHFRPYFRPKAYTLPSNEPTCTTPFATCERGYGCRIGAV